MSVYPSIRFNLYSKADVYFLAAVNDWTIDEGLSITPPFVLDLSARAHIVYTKYRRNIVFFFFFIGKCCALIRGGGQIICRRSSSSL
jgi:hypothetical protein